MPQLLNDGAEPPSSGMRNWMLDLGARLVDNGYPIIPILPGAKCPGLFTRGRWQGYPDWTRHCERLTKPFEISIWRGWPGCGIGVACGIVVGFDIDVTDGDAALEIQNFAFAELGQTPALRIGQQPKRLLVYRAKTPFASIKKHPLEALARGSQFVAYSQHPETGQPYQWPIEGLADLPLSALPVVEQSQMAEFLERAFHLVPPDLRRKTLGPDRSADHYYSGGDLRGTVAAVASAIAHIPNDDLHYDDWVRVGLAIKGAIGDPGWPMFDNWSARSSKYDAKTTARTWGSLKPNKIGAGTIYYFATQHGWVPEHELILNGALADAVAAVPVGSVQLDPKPDPAPEPKPAEPKNDTTADDLVADAGGLLGDIVGWMCDTAIYPQPFLSLAAAIAAVGTMAGRRYAGPWDTRTNVYCIGIAESGSGKEHQLTCLNNLFFAADLIELFAGEEISSGTAVESTLSGRAVQLFQIDEFGHFMKSIMNPRATSSHRRDVLVKLTKYTGAATRLVKGTEYANKKERERIDVHEPCVCLYGTTVAAPLWEAFGSGALGDGSVARMLFFQSPQSYPDHRKPKASAREVPPGIIDGARAIVAATDSASEFAFKTAKSQMLDGRHRPALTRIEYLPKAEEIADRWAVEQVGLKRAHETAGFAPVWARWLEHINRLALIRAISINPVAPKIGEQDLIWARALVEHCINTLINEADRYVADSMHEAMLKRLLDVIRKRGSMSGRELARATQWLTRRDRNEAISHLEEAGLVKVSRKLDTGGRVGILVEPFSHVDQRDSSSPKMG